MNTLIFHKFWKSRYLLFLALSLILFSNLFSSHFYWSIMIIPYFYLAQILKIPLKWFLIGSLFIITLFFLQSYIVDPKSEYFWFFKNFLDLQKWATSWVDSVYESPLSEFINLLIFGHKKTSIYKDFGNFGIIHLISISGLHVSFIFRYLEKIFNKSFVLLLLFLYWSLVGYSLPVLRILLMKLIPFDNEFKKWSISVFILLFVNIHIYKSISFLMSYFFYLCILLNRLLFRSKINVFFSNIFIPSCLSTIVSLILYKKLFAFQILNSILFSPIVLFLFAYFFVTWPLFFLSSIHFFFFKLFSTFKDSLYLNSSYLYIPSFNEGPILLFAFTLIFLLCLKFIIRKTEVY